LPQARRIAFNAVGGIDLPAMPGSQRAEALAKLRAADFVSVRDCCTLSGLGRHEMAAALAPDPATMIRELFDGRIQARVSSLDSIRRAWPHGYVAAQCSTDFADDATLTSMAAQFDAALDASGIGMVFFRAGAAPWHDDLDLYRRLAARMRHPTRIFESLHVWDICALIAFSRMVCGSSLHGRIVAMAYGLPRLGLRQSVSETVDKQGAYAATWEMPGMPMVSPPLRIAQDMHAALGSDCTAMTQLAAALAQHQRDNFQALVGTLETPD
jgi:hypothetical protein